MDATKVQLHKPMSSIGVIHRCIGEGLHTKAEVTQRQLHHQGSPQHG